MPAKVVAGLKRTAPGKICLGAILLGVCILVFYGDRFKASLLKKLKMDNFPAGMNSQTDEIQDASMGRDNRMSDTERDILTTTQKVNFFRDVEDLVLKSRINRGDQKKSTNYQHANEKSFTSNTTADSTNFTRVRSNLSHTVSVDSTIVAKRFAERNQRIRNICRNENERRRKGTQNGELQNKYLSLANQLLTVCLVPKIATKYMNYMKKQQSLTLLHDKQDNRLRKQFFIVRDPYERLVSGYICKILISPLFWKSHGIKIIQKFRMKSNATTENGCGNDVTFPEFVKYFIYSQENNWLRNEHFVPIHEQCKICQSQYDYVVHLETFREDIRHILESVNVHGNFGLVNEETDISKRILYLKEKRNKTERCESMCMTLKRVWWAYQTRGFISKEFKFPLTQDKCKTISLEEFDDVALSAYRGSVKSVDKSKQRREAVVKLYSQVPLSDKLKLKKILWLDFEMFGYDPQPSDLFP